MGTEHTFGIRLTADGKQLVGEVKASREEIDALKKSTDALSASTQRTAQQTQSYWAEQQRSANASAAAWLNGNAAADAAADKAWALANGYKEVGGQIVKAGGHIIKNGTESAKAMDVLGLNTQYARRELMQLGKEAATGDFSRMPGTFASLVTHSNILPALISPIGLAVTGVSAALAVGVYAWVNWGDEAESAADKARKAITGMKETDAVYILQREKEVLSKKIPTAWLSYDEKDLKTLSDDSQKLIAEYRSIDKQLRGEVKRSSSAWDALYATDEEHKNAELKKAKQLYDEQLVIYQTNKQELIAIELQYQQKIAAINTFFDEKAKKKRTPEINEQKHYESLTKSTADRIAALQAEAQQTDRLSESEKQLEIFNAQVAAGTAGLTTKHIEARRAQLESSVAVEQLTEAHRAELKAREDNLKGLESETAALRKQAEAARYETSIIGLNKEQIALLQAQRGDHVIAIMEERLAVLDATGACTAESEALRDQIKARQELKAALGGKAAAESTHTAIEEEKKAYVEMWRTIEHTGKDVFVQVLSNGKSAADGIGKALKASVIDMLYQMTLKRWIINISAVGGTTAGNSSLAGGLSAGGAQNGLSMPWGGSSMLGSGISMLGDMAGSAGMSAFGTGMGLSAAEAAAASGAYSAAGMGSIGSALSAGSALGAALPWIGGALVLGSALGMFGGGSGTYSQSTGWRAAGEFGPGGVSGTAYGLSSNHGENYQNPVSGGGDLASGAELAYGYDWEQGKALAMFEQVRASVAQSAALLGVQDAAAKLSDISVPFDVTVGMVPGGIAAALQQAATGSAEFMAQALIPNLQDFAQANESLAQTFQRLTQAAYQAQSAVGQGLVGGMQTLIGLADKMSALYLSDLSPLTAADRLAAAGGQYATLLAQARAGDMNAVGNLGGAAQAYLKEGRSYYASGQDYTDLFANVQGAVGDLVSTQLTDSSIAITGLKVPLEAIVSNTQNLDKRIADMLAAALAARAETDAAVIRAQTEAIVRATLDAARVTVSAQQAGALT